MSSRPTARPVTSPVSSPPISSLAVSSSAGFTLIELLVAITLFALLTTILAGGLRFGARVWEQADSVAAQITEVEASFSIVRRLIGGALPLATRTANGDPAVQFQGTSEWVSFVGPAPALAFVGGLHAITLARVRTRTGEQLVLQVSDFAPVPPDPKQRETSAAPGAHRTVVLVDGAERIEFAYFGNLQDTVTRVWQPNWLARTLLPELVAVRVHFPPGDRRVWPDLIVLPEVRESVY
jgi:prepilin-type N-terminal cleavage/methylation domain